MNLILCRQLHALCGDAQGKIATQRLVFESEVDQRVLQPYHEVLEVLQSEVVLFVYLVARATFLAFGIFGNT